MCGRKILDGYTNVDLQRSKHAPRDPDIFADARSIPLPDDCADELLVVHGWEHFYVWECETVIAEWRRLLKSGGRLVLELPNIVKCAANLISGAGLDSSKHPYALSMWGLYGDPSHCDPLMTHKWGWSPATLTEFLKARGFTNIREAVTQWHSTGRDNRDMRIEATKV